MDALLISIGGALGASFRYIVVQLLHDRSQLLSTLVVNVVGSFILGIVFLGVSDHELMLLVGVGFCGAFTTFSTFSYQTLQRWEEGRLSVAILNAGANLLLSLGGYGLAWFVIG